MTKHLKRLAFGLVVLAVNLLVIGVIAFIGISIIYMLSNHLYYAISIVILVTGYAIGFNEGGLK